MLDGRGLRLGRTCAPSELGRLADVPEPLDIGMQKQWTIEHRGTAPASDAAGRTAHSAGEVK